MANERQVKFRTRDGKKIEFVKSPKPKIPKVYPIIKEIKRNNKSRKGTYISIKLGRGIPAKEYKKKQGVPLEDYVDTAKHGIIGKKSGVTDRTNVKRKIEKTFGQKIERIEEVLHSGYAETTLQNGTKLTPYSIKAAYRRLLLNTDKAGDGLPIVRDKELIEILTRDENVMKYKHRIEYNIKVIGDKEETLASIAYTQARKTLPEIIKDMKESIKKGMEITDFSPTIKPEVEKRGYRYFHESNGIVKDFNIKMIFRKA